MDTDTYLWNQTSAGELRRLAASGAPVLLPVLDIAVTRYFTHPALVDRSQLAEATGPDIALESRPDHFVQRTVAFDVVTATGVAGDARSATSQKGDAIPDACATAPADWLLTRWGHDRAESAGQTRCEQGGKAGAGVVPWRSR